VPHGLSIFLAVVLQFRVALGMVAYVGQGLSPVSNTCPQLKVLMNPRHIVVDLEVGVCRGWRY
jgi:hypothetical protein